MFYKLFKYPLDLQLFAEDEGTTSEDNTNDQDGNNEDDQQDNNQQTFTQEDVDRIVQGRLAKERKSWERHLEEQKTEAEKLANMSEKEKKEYQEKKRIEDLDAREAAITRRELTAQAKVQLADEGIPTELAEILNFTDADSCKKSSKLLKMLFKKQSKRLLMKN